MLDVISNVDNIRFDVEDALDAQIGCALLPFPGMDKSGAAICISYRDTGICRYDQFCPYRHIKGDKNVVCKHWLRGLCKKGDDCEFLHEYDMTKMPECYFFSRYNACSNKECPFLHIDPESKIRDCPWYDRGFCRHGSKCKNRHVRRVMCLLYLNGFCPEGKDCKFVHPSFDAPIGEACGPRHHYSTNLFVPPLISQEAQSPMATLDLFEKFDPNDEGRIYPNRNGLAKSHLHSFSQSNEVFTTVTLTHLQHLSTPVAKKPIISCNQRTLSYLTVTSAPFLKRTLNNLANVVCHFCGDMGHKIANCPKLNIKDASELLPAPNQLDKDKLPTQQFLEPLPFERPNMLLAPPIKQPFGGNHDYPRRNFEDVTCYRCGECGHLASQCLDALPPENDNFSRHLFHHHRHLNRQNSHYHQHDQEYLDRPLNS